MDEGVDQGLVVAAFHIIGHLLTRVWSLAPHLPAVAQDEVLPILQKINQPARILRVIQCVEDAATFVQAIPTGAENPRPAHGAFIRKKRTRVGQDASFIHQAEGEQVPFLKALSRPLLEPLAQFGEGEVPNVVCGKLRVPCGVTPLQNQTLLLRCGRLYAFVADADECFQHSVRRIVIRRIVSTTYIQYHQNLAFNRLKTQAELGNRVQTGFYDFADLFGIFFRLCQSHSSAIVFHPKNQNAAIAVGKGTNAFAPALRPPFLHGLFFVVCRGLAYQIPYVHWHSPCALHSSTILFNAFSDSIPSKFLSLASTR